MIDKKQKVLFDELAIKEAVERLGKEISKDYDEPIVVISLLRGSFMFTADLVRAIDIPVVVDFMTTSSYEDRESSNGVVEIIHDVRFDIEGQNVLIVDDICDSGFTMKNIVDYLATKNPKSIKTCVMLDKPSRRNVAIEPDFVGETIEDVFIVGYGLNYGDYYRNIPYIFTFED